MTLTVDQSLNGYLSSLRGKVTRSRIGYPDCLILSVRDEAGKDWTLVTVDSDWEPHDPQLLVDQTLLDTKLSRSGRVLTLTFDKGLRLLVTAGEYESWDDPPYWELLTPDDQSVEYGPGPSWHVSDAAASLPPHTKAAAGKR